MKLKRKMKNKKCEIIESYLEDYLEGRLSPEEAAEIEEHLSSCSSCQKEFQAMRELFQALSSFPEEKISFDFTSKVMQKISQEVPAFEQSWWEKIHHLLTIPRLSLKWAAVCGVVLVTILLGYNFYFSPLPQEEYCPNNLAEITFSLQADASQVKSIAVVGDFNDWDPNRNPLLDDNNDGIWTATLQLEPGRYEYMFIIDGQKWVPDPAAYRYVSDGFGNKNAVIEINSCR